MQDPETNKSKGFGFCEFETAEGVLRALRLLHNLSLDGQELLLKCNTATQRYIDEYQASKQKEESKKEQAKQQADSDTDAAVKQEDSKADSQEDDDAVLVKIMALVSDRAAQQSNNHNAEQAADLLNEVLPPPPSHERSKSRTQASASKERTHSSRERERGSSADRNAERQFERERQRQRREVELRQADLERVYQKKLKDWEHLERYMLLNTTPPQGSMHIQIIPIRQQQSDTPYCLATVNLFKATELCFRAHLPQVVMLRDAAAVDCASGCSCRPCAGCLPQLRVM